MFFQKGGPFYSIAIVGFIYAFFGVILVRLKNSTLSDARDKKEADSLLSMSINLGFMGCGLMSEFFFMLVMFESSETKLIGIVILCSRLINVLFTLFFIAKIIGPSRISEYYVNLLDHNHLLINQIVYGMLVFMSLFDVNLLRLLPWKQSDFVLLSSGYPDVTFMRVCLTVKIVVSFVSLMAQSIFLNLFVLQGNEKYISVTSLIYLFVNLTVFATTIGINLYFCYNWCKKMRRVHKANIDLGKVTDVVDNNNNKWIRKNPIHSFFFKEPEMIPTKEELKLLEEEKHMKDLETRVMEKVDITVESGLHELEDRLLLLMRQMPLIGDMTLRESTFSRIPLHDDHDQDSQVPAPSFSSVNEVRLTSLYQDEMLLESNFEMVAAEEMGKTTKSIQEELQEKKRRSTLKSASSSIMNQDTSVKDNNRVKTVIWSSNPLNSSFERMGETNVDEYISDGNL